MVTAAAFNALLKLVEEPPEFVKFVFVTTEPDKVIGTIRSTHHYPFRLIPPGVLRDLLARLCEQEQVTVEPGVLPLVVGPAPGPRAMPCRCSTSCSRAPDRAGLRTRWRRRCWAYTDATLLDDIVDAFAASDATTVFTVVDRIIEGGDPRRFVADLLERLARPHRAGRRTRRREQGAGRLPGGPARADGAQAGALAAAEPPRAADIVNAGLTEMRGATSPRLQPS